MKKTLRWMVARVWPLMVLLGVLFVADQAEAQSREQLVEARTKFQEGTELEQAEDWVNALLKFREVGQVKMTPQVRYHIAFCQARLGRLVAAMGGFKLALEEAHVVGDSFRAEVEAAIEGLQSRIPRLIIKRGENAATAEISLDDVKLGASATEQPMPLDPGLHRVSASRPGHKDFAQTVELEEGGERTLVVRLDPVSVPAVVAPKPVASEPPVLPYVIGGGGIVALAAGTTLWILRGDRLSELDQACPGRDCSKAADVSVAKKDYDRLKTYNWTSQVALGVGVVGVGAAAVMLLMPELWRSERASEWQDSAWRVAPVVNPSVVGVDLHADF